MRIECKKPNRIHTSGKMKCHRQYVCLLWQVIFFITNCLAENLILNINVKKAIAVTDQAFLSFTLDPATLQYNDFM